MSKEKPSPDLERAVTRFAKRLRARHSIDRRTAEQLRRAPALHFRVQPQARQETQPPGRAFLDHERSATELSENLENRENLVMGQARSVPTSPNALILFGRKLAKIASRVRLSLSVVPVCPRLLIRAKMKTIADSAFNFNRLGSNCPDAFAFRREQVEIGDNFWVPHSVLSPCALNKN